jgi:hypothetical protein
VWKEYKRRESIKEAELIETMKQLQLQETRSRLRIEARESILQTERDRIADCFRLGKLPGTGLNEAEIEKLVQEQMVKCSLSSSSGESSSPPASSDATGSRAGRQLFFQDSQEIVDAMRQVQSEIVLLISMTIDLAMIDGRPAGTLIE